MALHLTLWTRGTCSTSKVVHQMRMYANEYRKFRNYTIPSRCLPKLIALHRKGVVVKSIASFTTGGEISLSFKSKTRAEKLFDVRCLCLFVPRIR